MSRGFRAGESRYSAIDAAMKTIEKDAAAYFKNRTGGFEFGETTATAEPPRWMPPSNELPSYKESKDKFGNTSAESSGTADGKFILKQHPDKALAAKVIREAILAENKARGGPTDYRSDAVRDADALKSGAPEYYAAMTKAVYERAVGRSQDVKTKTEVLKRDAAMGATYNEAWSAASRAFASGDEAAKAVLKKGDDTYDEVREWRGPASKNNFDEIVSRKVDPKSPGIPGRVAAVNAGILAGIKEASRVIDKDKSLSIDQKAFIKATIYDRLVSDKHGFLAYREYIPKTAIYVGPLAGGRVLDYLDTAGGYV